MHRKKLMLMWMIDRKKMRQKQKSSLLFQAFMFTVISVILSVEQSVRKAAGHILIR